MHRGLQRQLKRTLGLADPQELESLLAAAAAVVDNVADTPGIDPRVVALLRNFGALVERVDATYDQSDRDLDLRTRSLELSSAELSAANARLREDIDARARAVASLRATVTNLVGDDQVGGVGDKDELESLSRIIANLVAEREQQRNRLDSLKFALDQHAIVSITNTAGDILYANDRFCEITQYPREELIGKNHRIVKSGRHPAAMFDEMWRTISSGEVWHGEICNRAKDGTEYWVAATIVPFLDESGLPYEYIAIRTDITSRKLVEDELIQARDGAEAANRAKSDFLANMSHEIRTPMNGILGMTDLALDTELNEEQREYLSIVKSSAESLLVVINDILDFSKIEAGKLLIEKIRFNLRRTLADTLKTLTLRAHQKGLEIVCDIAGDVPMRLIGDPGRLRQILLNLVGNAIKFTERGQVVVNVDLESMGQGSAVLRVAVSDSGVGIPREKQAHIFEAFAQEDSSTTRRFGGTGLGLTISNRLVELMGGSLDVQSEVGVGSTFTFTLALGIDANEAPPAAISPEALAGRRVLVIDDNAVNREVFTRQLGRWKMDVATVESGKAAQVWLSSQAAPDVILLDVHMPEMDGFEVAEWIKEQPRLRPVPIIVLSSGAQRRDSEFCRKLGLDAYFSKPVAEAELQAALCSLFGMSEHRSAQSGPAPAPIKVGVGMTVLDVLVVEDNPINQQLALRLLEKWGHTATIVNNGQESLAAIEANRFDVILMDMQMPVMDGLEATRRIRAREQAHGLPRLPIIAMTANAMQGDREICLAAGMDDYLAKPIKAADLAAKLGGIAVAMTQTAREEYVATTSDFDYAAALKGMDQEIIEIITPVFLGHYADELAALRSAIALGDGEAASRHAHGLKGTLAAFGAQPAERRAAEMEALAKAGDLSKLPVFQAALEGEISRLVGVLAASANQAS